MPKKVATSKSSSTTPLERDRTVRLQFLNKEIAVLAPTKDSSSSPSQLPAPNPPTRINKRKNAVIVDDDVDKEDSESLESSDEVIESAKKAQKQRLAKKKKECKKYRSYSVEQGERVSVVKEKLYLKSVKLIDREWDIVDGEKKEVEKDVQVIDEGRKVKIFGVEEVRTVLGVSVPLDGKRYAVYTHDKETDKFEAYPLQDITEILNTTITDEEQERDKKLRGLWWQGVMQSVVVKKEKKNVPPKRRQLSTPSRPNNHSTESLSGLHGDIDDLKACIEGFGTKLEAQCQALIEFQREMTMKFITASIDLAKASR